MIAEVSPVRSCTGDVTAISTDSCIPSPSRSRLVIVTVVEDTVNCGASSRTMIFAFARSSSVLLS